MGTTAPELRTERLLLRGIGLGDADDVYAYASDPEVARFTSWAAHTSPADTVGYLRGVTSEDCAEDGRVFHCWAISRVTERTVIGAIGFRQLRPHRGRIDFVLGRPHWRRGYMSEAARAVLDWAFSQISTLDDVVSGGLSENAGSARVLEKCGLELYRREEITFRHNQFAGETREVSHFRIARAAWHARQIH